MKNKKSEIKYGYAIFSTTADVGIRIRGKTYEELYENGVKGLNALVFGKEEKESPPVDAVGFPFQYEGDSCENVLVNLLAEVVFLVYNREKITEGIEIKTAGKNFLKARLLLRSLGPDQMPEIEIKSVTYHNLKVVEEKGIKSAEIVFDV